MDDFISGSGATRRFTRKKELILSVATHILNSRGVKGMTLSDVAASVGLNTTSVTYYFKRKEDLAAACMLHGVRRYTDLIADAARHAAPQDRIRALVSACIDLNARIRHREAPPLPIFNDLRALRDPHYSQVLEPFNELFRALRRLIMPADSKWIDRNAATARTHLLISQLFRLDGWLWRFETVDYGRVKERLNDILLAGLAPPEAAWSPTKLAQFETWRREQQESPADAFLRSAAALISQRGYRGASVSQISAQLNLTKGAFYHHLDTKDELVAACFARSFDLLRRIQSEAMALPETHWGRLVSAIAALVELQVAETSLLLGRSVINSLPEEMRQGTLELHQRASDRFAALITDGARDGSIRAVDPLIAANLLIAMISSSADYARIQRGVAPEEAPALYARPLLMGLLTP